MNKLRNILLTFTIGAFLLPFVPPSCADMTDEAPPVTSSDSTSLTADTTLAIDGLVNKSDKIQLTQNDSETMNSDTLDSRKKNVFLFPDKENFSGLGYLISFL